MLGNPPINTPSRCANARTPDNGRVRCSRESDVMGLTSGGKSSSQGPGTYTCHYRCDIGYELNGPSVLECPIEKTTDNPTCEPGEYVFFLHAYFN